MKKRGKFFKHRAKSLPMCITEGIVIANGGVGTISQIKLGVLPCMAQLAKGGLTDREAMDSIGKFIALTRLTCIEYDAIKARREQSKSVWAVMVLAAEHWRAVEARYIAKGVISLMSDERNAIETALQVAFGYLETATESMIAWCWSRLENETQIRMLLGFDPTTGQPSLDDGKLDEYLKEAA